MQIAIIKELWRYPVKSCGGESLSSALIGAGSVCGDWLSHWLGTPAQLKPRAPRSDSAFYALPNARTEQQIARELGLDPNEPLPHFGAFDEDVAAALQFNATSPGFLHDAFPGPWRSMSIAIWALTSESSSQAGLQSVTWCNCYNHNKGIQ
jgi:hypothetical protein